MSHFSVLVITPTKPSDDELSKILQPWHEFECTGVDDQYVIDVDKTEKMRKEYEEETESGLKGPDGTLYTFFDDKGNWREKFSQPDPQQFEPDRRKRFVPSGYEEVEIPTKTVKTFRQYVAYQTSEKKEFPVNELLSPDHKPVGEQWKYGYTLIDDDGEVVKVIDRTNPNAKWDWWVVGGRYAGKCVPDYDPAKVPGNHETCFLCNGTGMRMNQLGVDRRREDPTYKCNGCDGSGKKLKFPTLQKPVESDQVQIKDIPIEALRADKEQKAARQYDAFHRIVAGRPIPIWDEIRERHGVDKIEDACKEYRDNPVTVDLKKSDEFKNRWSIDEGLYVCTRDEYLARARSQAITAFAVVKDGQWYEQGKMGWWACVFDEKDQDAWQRELDSLLSGLSPETWITVVDCHI